MQTPVHYARSGDVAIAYQAVGEGPVDTFRGWFVGHMRRSLSPGAALAFQRMMMEAIRRPW